MKIRRLKQIGLGIFLSSLLMISSQSFAKNELGATGVLGTQAKSLHDIPLEQRKDTRKRSKRHKKTLFKLYENRYVWLFETFVPTIDVFGKVGHTSVNFVSATDIFKKEDAEILCLKVIPIRDLALEYISMHPLVLDKNKAFNSIEVGKNIAAYISKNLGVNMIRYMILFEGIYAGIEKSTKINGYLPKTMINTCVQLKGKLKQDDESKEGDKEH